MDQRDLLQAANAYAGKHGAAALQAILQATCGVGRVVDVPPEDRVAALAALMDGEIRAQSRRTGGTRELDTQGIWNRFNSAGQKQGEGADDDDRPAATIDVAAIYARFNSYRRDAE